MANVYGTNGNDPNLSGFDNSNNSIYGYNGNDNLFGRSGDDYLNGGAQNDRLYGGTGLNDLIGGRAATTSRCRHAGWTGTSNDYIVDFQFNVDEIYRRLGLGSQRLQSDP